MSISIKVRATPDLNKLAKKIGNGRRVANRQWAAQLYGMTIRNFEAQGVLLGEPWKPLSERTAKRKEAEGYSPLALLRTGNLRQSFLPFSDDKTAGVGARASFGVDYAKVHQEGSDRVPARPMLPTAETVIETGVRVYEFVISKATREFNR